MNKSVVHLKTPISKDFMVVFIKCYQNEEIYSLIEPSGSSVVLTPPPIFQFTQIKN